MLPMLPNFFNEIHSPTAEINLFFLQKNVNLQTSNVGMKNKKRIEFLLLCKLFCNIT